MALSNIADKFTAVVRVSPRKNEESKGANSEDGTGRLSRFQYFESIFGLPFISSQSPTGECNGEAHQLHGHRCQEVAHSSQRLSGPLNVCKDDEDFAQPFDSPSRIHFKLEELKYGFTVTVASVERLDRFIVFEFASSHRLMNLETEMNVFYGMYLMKKRAQHVELTFNIVEGGYYAAYIEPRNMWARCYVTLVGPHTLEHGNEANIEDPNQEIQAILIDYGINAYSFTRKQLLPLKKSFLHLCVQKLDASIVWRHNAKNFARFSRDLKTVSKLATFQQFHARIMEYKPDDEPLPSAILELGDVLHGD